MNMNQKGFASIALVVVIIAIVAVGGYFVFSKKSSTLIVPPTPTPTSTSSSGDFYEVAFQDFDLKCLGMGGSQEFVVRTQAEYQRLIDTSPDLYPNPFVPCIDYEFPIIDFAQKTLLGNAIGGGGCSSEVKKKVLRNDNDREVIYSITATFIGTCEKIIRFNNFILVPKIPEDYAVKFEANSQSDL